ncbi:MAG: ATP-binding cassette domain-containing protein, partial [Desulfobacterales bacterium]|nr:ATP-binding cassette domain-containing protein [Desulfobacterales bacterium]
GAGKTTAFNLLTGVLQPTAGEVSYRGMSLKGCPPHKVVKLGIARSFQDLKLFRGLSVLDNVMLAFPNQAGDRLWRVFFTPGVVAAQERANLANALSLLAFVGLRAKAGEFAADLSYAEEKLLVVARLMGTQAEVLLFDEPLSGLAPNTLASILPIFRELADSGRTVAIIEHNLDVISQLCDTAIFLDEGRKLAQAAPADLMRDPVLAGRYFK